MSTRQLKPYPYRQAVAGEGDGGIGFGEEFF